MIFQLYNYIIILYFGDILAEGVIFDRQPNTYYQEDDARDHDNGQGDHRDTKETGGWIRLLACFFILVVVVVVWVNRAGFCT